MKVNLPSNLARLVTKKEIDNPKGETFEERFIDVLSDPSNLFIPRVAEAGTAIGDYFVMHSGIKVHKNSYYGDFSQIFSINKGVHEPAEERMFAEVLKVLPENPLMIELGSYWAFYSIWFKKTFPGGEVICVEPEADNLAFGRENFRANGIDPETIRFIQAFVGEGHLLLSQFLRDGKINQVDLLHVDIQGWELKLIEDIFPYLKEKRVKYLFLSTHSNLLHYHCAHLLMEAGYRIIAEADFEDETFCYDGIIVACPQQLTAISNIDVGCRRHTPLRDNPFATKDIERLQQEYSNANPLALRELGDKMKEDFRRKRMYECSLQIESLKYPNKILGSHPIRKNIVFRIARWVWNGFREYVLPSRKV